ncbi:hypothetical protein COUCH_26360 [Couchioplanes caeruleus]|uniref:hypothetical protein n=1 Tax=Couchioplanes caeruleus TaxID=56438 RepID=UPI0020C0EA75|nr:hypothetical protein [Couchioplanes caeruleus]UQU62540.1 hypothetical protein COUCH_26360 [Couchioplanes caeruleus]
MTVTAGPDNIITIAGQHLTDLFFYLPSAHVPTVVLKAGAVLYATSLFLAMLAFHLTVARYTLTIAREGVLPQWLAITRADEVAATASLLQSVLAFTTRIQFAASPAVSRRTGARLLPTATAPCRVSRVACRVRFSNSETVGDA